MTFLRPLLPITSKKAPMKSTPTPWTHTGITTQEITTEFGPSGGIFKHTVTVPPGTSCVKLEGGSDPWVVQDLTCIPDKHSIAYSDADIYGIRIPESQITDIRDVSMPKRGSRP